MSDLQGSTQSWAKEIVEYYRQGYSDAEVAAAMNSTMKQFNTMLGENPTFNKLVEFGRTLQKAYWEGLARKNVDNKQFNSGLYSFYMKNKFAWADKIETSNVNENTNLSEDEMRADIMKRIKKLGSPELADAMKVLTPQVIEEPTDD